MNKFPANFVANAGIKDIVGQGLIFNDNIALIELVKNSKDAGSDKVDIFFNSSKSDLSDTNFDEIVICDTGCGMTQSEVISKWLNIAYSEKKGAGQLYAGNKGVGRFSCDRLGRELVLYSKSEDGEYIKLPINWADFENKGQRDEISTIPLEGELLSRREFESEVGRENFHKGTVLKIRKLRSEWGLSKIRKLVSELEKFSPSLDQEFSVYLYVDRIFDDPIDSKLNRKIDNGILNKLAFKTTYIKSSIDSEGEFLTTNLFFQGDKIYSYKAKNPYKRLKSVSVEIHYLDTLSKAYFTKNIGINANSYGSIFLFYNGFRISPYGNEKNDWLGLDQRKSQGTSRNLGTRDVIGRIDIVDRDETFSVITSREGLTHNSAFYDLVAYDQEEKTILKNGKEEYGFVTIIARQLENFVVSGLDWNRLIDRLGRKGTVSADDVKKDPDRYIVKKIDSELITEACDRILRSSLEVDDFFVNTQLISHIQEINEEKYSRFVADFVKTIGQKSLSEINPHEKGVVKKIIEEEKAKTEAALKEWDYAEKKAEVVAKERDIERQKGLYLLSTRRLLSDDADGLIHTIKINNIEIKEGIDSLVDNLSQGKISKVDVLERLSSIKLYALKTLKMAELATRSSYDRDIAVRSIDIEEYILEYLNIYKDTFGDEGVEVSFERSGSGLKRKVSVLNLSIVFDNLVSNSVKWGATQFKCKFRAPSKEELMIVVSDDGAGVSDRFLDVPEAIFELGVRDEPPEDFGGSGIGLYYSRQLLSEMGASIEFIGNSVDLKGAAFKVVFK